MPDRQAPVNIIQNSFATGEISPNLYGRTDLQKYHSACAVLRNFYVDYKGGVTTRPGTQYIGAPGSAGYARLWSFQFSPQTGQSYVLVFSDHNLRFIKNPGTPSYPNSSNAGLIFSGGVPYEIATPYAEADLRGLHFLQIADVMWITCHTCPRMKLSRFSDTNWTLTPVGVMEGPSRPTVTEVSISANPSGSSDPGTSRYMYAVSAVDADGHEGPPSIPFIGGPGINIGATQGTVTVKWNAVANAQFYKVYKALPTHGDKAPQLHEQLGFIGYSYGTLFTDSNIVSDFAHPPIGFNNPFADSAIIGYTITSPGSGYPAIGTSISISDSTGTGAIVYPSIGTNDAAATNGITGLYIVAGGHNYTAPTATATTGTGFSATFQLSEATGNYPKAVGVFQQRLIYASTLNKPNSIFASRVGAADDFRKSNPTIDSDAFEFAIFDHEVTEIEWVHSMPGGLLIGTNNGVFQLTGGSSTAANPVAVTPSNAVMVPQTSYGAADLLPIVIDSNVLYVQAEGSVVRDMQYNFYANVYSSSDITILSSHMLENDVAITDWSYQDTPYKVIWARLTSGMMLSLTYLKSQEIYGWARHDTLGGFIESITSLQEGTTDAVYWSVQRGGVRCIERMASQEYFQKSDAWQLDSAVSISSNFPIANGTIYGFTGNNIRLTTDAPVFGPGDIGKRIYYNRSSATIMVYDSPTEVHVNITSEFLFTLLPSGQWRMDPVVGSVSGLAHLEGQQVFALVDGEPQGPFIVAGGAITLTTPGSQIVVGIKFVAQLQPLYIDVGGEMTIQGKRKKIAAASIRVRNAAGLKYGTSFFNLKEWEQGTTSTDPKLELPYGAVGLYTGDQRINVNQVFTVGGWVCVQQDEPLPATVMSIIPELAQGDTP